MADDYDQKLRDMQKYVPFLENLIQSLKKSNKHDEKREAQLNKMQMFYDLLTNKNKKLKLETLERCEQVLVKLHQKAEKMKIDIPLTTDILTTTTTDAKPSTSKQCMPVISSPEQLKSSVEHNQILSDSDEVSPKLSTIPASIQKESTTATDFEIPAKEADDNSTKLQKVHPILEAEEVNAGSQAEEVHANFQAQEVNAGSQAEEVNAGSQPEEVNAGSQAEEVNAGSQAEEVNAGASKSQETNVSKMNNMVFADPQSDSFETETSPSIGNDNKKNQQRTSSDDTEASIVIEKPLAIVAEPAPSPDCEAGVESSTDHVADIEEEEVLSVGLTDNWKSTKRKDDDEVQELLETGNKLKTTPGIANHTSAKPTEEEIIDEPAPTCSSMESGDDGSEGVDESIVSKTAEKPGKMSTGDGSDIVQPSIVSSSTMKHDLEDCSVTSTTAIDSRRDKTGDESDEQNSLQDTVTDSSSNNESVNKNWIEGALLNLLNPSTLNKSTVLGMLEKVVESNKFEQIKAILAAEENKQPAEKNDETVAARSVVHEEKTENDICVSKQVVNPAEIETKSDEPITPCVISQPKETTTTRPATRLRRTELDRLNEDVKFILDTDTDYLGSQAKRACTENKAAKYCELELTSKAVASPKENPSEEYTPKPKKKKKKYEVFSYRTRRRSRKKKQPKPSALAALVGQESGADGTESSLGGADESNMDSESLLENPDDDMDEAEENASVEPVKLEVEANEIAEVEKNFKNIHPEMHSMSKHTSTCAICKFSGRYITTHYMNSHRMTEMVVSRLPPAAQERVLRGEGVDSKFAGKDGFQNRVYQYSCPFCNIKKNYARKIWSQHFGSHTGEYKYKCSGCGYMSVNVRGHIMKYCPGERPIMLEYLDRGQDIVGFICKLCNFIQMNRENVITHLENQHECSDGTGELVTEVTLFRSDVTNMQNPGPRKKAVEVSAKPSLSTQKQIGPPKERIQQDIKKKEGSSAQNRDEILEVSVKSETNRKIVVPKSADGRPLKNIYPYMHAQSEYVHSCVLCDYSGKFMTKHYVKEHRDNEVFVARIPPDRQARILANENLTKLGPVTVVKYKNYYRHSACPFCPVEKSSQRFDWVMHFATHTGEYKFRCTECNHYGNARNEFGRHFKIGCPNGKLLRLWSYYKYNEEDPVKGFLCKLCNYIQMSRNNVVKHLETQHETTVDEMLEITLFTGNPRFKGRRSVRDIGLKKPKRSKRKIKHVVKSGVLNLPDFLCEGEVDEDFMAEEAEAEDGLVESKQRRSKSDDYDLALPMHEIKTEDFGDGGIEHLFQMEMDETGTGVAIQPSQKRSIDAAERSRVRELVRPAEDPLQNIHPEMHSQSAYASKCLLCNFAGKYIAKHYIEEHTDYEVLSSRLPPEVQQNLLSDVGNMPIRSVIRSRKMHYYFSCPFCKTERDCTRHNWVAHFAIHTGEYKYQCSLCSHRGNATRDFKRHLKGKCKFAQQIRMWPPLVSKEEPIIAYFCNLCNFLQLDRGRLIKHLEKQHNCYEPLVGKVTLLFIDPDAGEIQSTAGRDGVPARGIKRTGFKRRRHTRNGKRRRAISQMWSSSSQKRAQQKRWQEFMEDNPQFAHSDTAIKSEEEDEEYVEGERNDGADLEQAISEQDEDVIEIDDSDEEAATPRPNPNTSATGYEKIQKFIERTESKANILKVNPLKKFESESGSSDEQATLPCGAPTKERPLSNVHPEMHSQSAYAKKCILCSFVGRHLVNHYISSHPRFEVPISRLPPLAQQLLMKNENNLPKQIETNPYSPKLFAHICVFCDSQFTFSIKSWVDHIGTHTGEYNFKCSECGRMINHKSDIHEHIRTICRNGKALARQFPLTENMQLPAYICKLCNFVQMNRINIIQHLRGQHKVLATVDLVQQVVLLRFDRNAKKLQDIKPNVVKTEDRIKVENMQGDAKYKTREYVKVDQSDAIYEILVPEMETKGTPSTSGYIKKEKDTEFERQTYQGLCQKRQVPGKPQLTLSSQGSSLIRRSAPPACPQSVNSSGTCPSSSVSDDLVVVQRISHLGYSQAADGTMKYHCCVRTCTFKPTTVPIALATHIMDDHSALIWEGYCRECQGHVATGKNMKLTKEIQHLFEHTRKRPADVSDSKEDKSLEPQPKIARRSNPLPQSSATTSSGKIAGAPTDDSASQIIARFANNKSITITRELKGTSSEISSVIPPPGVFPPQRAASSKQQQVLKEVKRTTLKPWTVSKSVKDEKTVQALLSDLSLFAFFKCMGNNCQFTTNDSNKMAEHLTFHSELVERNKAVQKSAESNVFSWLECCYCSTWAGTVMQLIAHITAKHIRDGFQCPYCFYRSCEEYNVVVHIRHYHGQVRLSILFCFGRRLLKPGGDMAIQAVTKTKCSGCTCSFMNPIAFATNVVEYTDSDLGGDIYKCYYCSKKHTKSLIEFARHIVEHRPIRKAEEYQCLKCLKKHTNLQQASNRCNLKAFQCVHCAYSTDDESLMGLHMAQVHASNLLFCGMRINIATTSTNEDAVSRMDNGAAFVLLRKRVDEKMLYKCPYTPTQLNYLNTAIEVPQENEEEDEEMEKPLSSSPVITQKPGGLQIATVQSLTTTEFASLITIDDSD